MSSKKHNKNLKDGGKREIVRPKQIWNSEKKRWEKS
jgi:hypothetical protein